MRRIEDLMVTRPGSRASGSGNARHRFRCYLSFSGLHPDRLLHKNPQYDVVITCNYSPWSRYKGGAQKSVHMLASSLADEGKRVCVVYSKVPWETVPVPA